MFVLRNADVINRPFWWSMDGWTDDLGQAIIFPKVMYTTSVPETEFVWETIQGACVTALMFHRTINNNQECGCATCAKASEILIKTKIEKIKMITGEEYNDEFLC